MKRREHLSNSPSKALYIDSLSSSTNAYAKWVKTRKSYFPLFFKPIAKHHSLFPYQVLFSWAPFAPSRGFISFHYTYTCCDAWLSFVTRKLWICVIWSALPKQFMLKPKIGEKVVECLCFFASRFTFNFISTIELKFTSRITF